MSSPNGQTEPLHRQAPMTQQSPQASNNETEEAGVTVKPMRLKVLYTFDDQNKTNCLARWPQILQIRTIAMDETTAIGVIELKTCIQAIVQCSPELVAKLGQDYTVYAYDYSEYDNPLVGQGMLSWALAAASPTPDVPAHQSRQLITGRVCKNIQGLFSNGVAETLEVKLRLVPVPTVLQSEYVSSMEKYRELSKVMPAGFDHNEWFAFLQSNPNIVQVANRINSPATNTPSQRDGFSMEVVNQLLSPSLTQTSVDPFNNLQGADSDLSEVQGAATTSGGKGAKKSSRPSSRASVKRPYKRRAKATLTGGNTSGYEEGTDGDEGPPGKKRAKITKADWNSKSSFGSASDSLRVAASTAGSLRLFRPIALAPAPSNKPGNHLQEIPRAPTPVPSIPPQVPARGRAPSQSSLRRDSVVSQYMDSQPRRYHSPYQPSEVGQESQDNLQLSIESAMTSPERNESQGETPPEFGSSPPVLRTGSPYQFSPPPSSPMLPQMPRTDSGFMSGDVSELFDDDDEMRPIEEADVNVAAKYNSRRRSNYRPAPQKPEVHHGFAIQEVTPGPPELLPTKMLPRAEPRPKADPKPKASRPRTSTLRADSTMSDDGICLPAPKAQRVISDLEPLLSDAPPVMPALTDNAECEQVSAEFRPREGLPEPQLGQIPIEPQAETPSTEPQRSSAHGSQQFSGSIQSTVAPVVAGSRPASRMLSRTASIGSLTLPTVPASDPLPPPSNLHTECQPEVPHPVTDVLATDERMKIVGGASAATIIRKTLIRRRLEAAIAKGEMPPFCSNCGAIDTPTWRKAYSQECQGEPGFHQYSDEPGKVTAIDVLERDSEGKPTAYKLYKKSLAQGEDNSVFNEILLCNPCGIWLSKYKTQRPEDKWVKDHERAQERLGLVEKKPAERKKRERPSRSKRAQSGYQGDATSEANFQSDAPGAIDRNATLEASNEPPSQAAPSFSSEQETRSSLTQRASSVQPAKRSMKAMSPGTASAALRRAIQSSPARWLGTQHSPIELEEDLGPTRRLLFPSPRRDESFGVLSEVTANSNQSTVSFHNPLAQSKDLAVETSDKENCPPTLLFEDGDDELRKLFEEEMARPTRPTTPIQKYTEPNPFKTPTRPTPSHRPITRSISKSAKSANKIQMLPQRTPSRTPSTIARRRSPRHRHAVPESPFTATLSRLLSESNEPDNTNESPSRHLDLGLDLSELPDLGHSGVNGIDSDTIKFQIPVFGSNHDFFSTDIPMPSSPPRMFDLYEDPLTMGMHGMDSMDSSMWSDFNLDDTALQSLGQGLLVDENGHATFDIGKAGADETSKIKMEIARTGDDEDDSPGEERRSAI